MKNILSVIIGCFFFIAAFSQNFKAGSKVEIKWNGSWYKGSVLEVKDGKYKVHYEGWTSYWDEWVGNDRLKAEGAKEVKPKKETTSNTLASTQTPKTPEVTGANPAAGKWVATVNNGYKGDKITFTVSADGKRILNVEFSGYWRSRTSGIEILKNLDPPEPFTITKGAFNSVQQVPNARMWWEFIGKFTTPTTAEGTYRAAYAGGENDTYQLKWSAKKL